MNEEVTLNLEQRLYVIPEARGFSCLGFDVAFQRTGIYADELQETELLPKKKHLGTLAGYREYQAAVQAARARYETTGRRMNADLTPQLVGLEGQRVEVVDCYGQRRRFKVGKSTGWIPVHLELANRRSSGGGAVMGAPFQSVRIVPVRRAA